MGAEQQDVASPAAVASGWLRWPHPLAISAAVAAAAAVVAQVAVAVPWPCHCWSLCPAQHMQGTALSTGTSVTVTASSQIRDRFISGVELR